MTTTENLLPATAAKLAAQALAGQFDGKLLTEASGTWNTGRAIIELASGQILEIRVTETY
jgi:hypothetical protein